MRHEKLIKRPDGSTVNITVSVYISDYRANPGANYNVYVTHKAKGKRTWQSPFSGNDYEYRRLSMEEREAYAFNKYLAIATKEEIDAAKLELWQMLKPI